MNPRENHAMKKISNHYPEAVIQERTGIYEAVAKGGKETSACAGMTTGCRSRSLIYRPAENDTMVRDENGGSMVEFALIAPLLFVILFGIIEFGVLLFDKAVLTNASREGARAGIVYDFDSTAETNHPDDATIITAVQEYCQDYLISFGSASTLTIDISRAGSTSLDSAGDHLTVNVTYPFRFLVFSNILALIGGDIGETLTLEAETVMRME
jgi:Flp pilus assembly protein TadG